MGMKPKTIKYGIAIILRSGHRPGEYLIVRRPSDDADLAGSWGLPAITLKPDESPEDGARRVCKEKPGCSAEPIRFLGAMHQERNSYNLLLMDVEMILLGATQPDVTQAQTTGTALHRAKMDERSQKTIAFRAARLLLRQHLFAGPRYYESERLAIVARGFGQCRVILMAGRIPSKLLEA